MSGDESPPRTVWVFLASSATEGDAYDVCQVGPMTIGDAMIRAKEERTKREYAFVALSPEQLTEDQAAVLLDGLIRAALDGTEPEIAPEVAPEVEAASPPQMASWGDSEPGEA